LTVLKAFDVTQEELGEVQRRWLEWGVSWDSMPNSMHVVGARRSALVRAFDDLGPEEALSLLQAWMCIADMKRSEMPSARVCLTGINPEGFRQPILDTLQAFQEVVSRAKRRLVIIGYRLNDGDSRLMAALEEGMRDRGLEVCLVTDHMNYRLGHGDQKRILSWVSDSTMNFHLWGYEAEDRTELMHVKCMMADTALAYVGSANFSYGGSWRNVELGLLVRDASVLLALDDLFSYLISGEVKDVQEIDYVVLRNGGYI
jgi:hypothetical protein